MNKNVYLEKAQKILNKQKYYTKFQDENILEVAFDKESKAIAYLIIEKEQFPGIVLSLAVDCHETYTVADLTIQLMYICPVALGEAFYRSKNGNLYWDEAAIEQFTLETDPLILQDIEPESKHLH